jgi:hypothetical protein
MSANTSRRSFCQRDCRLQPRQVLGLDDRRLVGEHVQPGFESGDDAFDLAAVAARKDGDAARRLAPHPVEKIGSGMDVEPPIGRRFRPSVIPGDAAQIVDEVGPQRRMHPHQRRQPRIYLLLHQRGVEMTGIDDDKADIGHAGERLHAIRGKARGPLCRLLLPGIGGALPSAAKR